MSSKVTDSSRDLDRDGDIDLADNAINDLNRDGRIDANDREGQDVDNDQDIDATDRSLNNEAEKSSVGETLGLKKGSEGWSKPAPAIPPPSKGPKLPGQ
jgi:hypothetical protein